MKLFSSLKKGENKLKRRTQKFMGKLVFRNRSHPPSSTNQATLKTLDLFITPNKSLLLLINSQHMHHIPFYLYLPSSSFHFLIPCSSMLVLYHPQSFKLSCPSPRTVTPTCSTTSCSKTSASPSKTRTCGR